MKNENEQFKSQTGYKMANTFKKFGTKVLMGVLALGIVIGGSFVFVACNDKTTQVQEPPATIQPGHGGEIGPNPGGEIEVQKTFAEFLQSDVAQEFVSIYAAKSLGQKEGIMGEEYYVTGQDNVVTGINFLYIFGDKETENRAVELINIKFSKPIDVNDIWNDVDLSANYRLSTQKIMDFNAKTNKLNPEIANALYSAANLKNQDLKLFNEIEDYQDNYRTFTLFSQEENNKIQLVELTVESDETNENLLKNLADSSKVYFKNGRSYLNDDNKIVFSDEYDLGEENYKPDEQVNPDPGGEVEPDKVTDAEVIWFKYLRQIVTTHKRNVL